MTDAIFTVDDDNAVIRYYPSRVPGLSGNARRAVIAALLPSLQALAEYLGRLTGAQWTMVDAEARDENIDDVQRRTDLDRRSARAHVARNTATPPATNTAEAYPGQGALWDAINQFATTCGGDPGSGVYGNLPRMRAVVAVERAARSLRGEK